VPSAQRRQALPFSDQPPGGTCVLVPDGLRTEQPRRALPTPSGPTACAGGIRRRLSGPYPSSPKAKTSETDRVGECLLESGPPCRPGDDSRPPSPEGDGWISSRRRQKADKRPKALSSVSAAESQARGTSGHLAMPSARGSLSNMPRGIFDRGRPSLTQDLRAVSTDAFACGRKLEANRPGRAIWFYPPARFSCV
jgi:hypothetical protein